MKYQPPFKWPVPSSLPAGLHNDDADAPYVNGNPTTGTPGSIAPAEAWEHTQREIIEVIKHFLGPTVPDHTDLTQLRQAIQAAVGQGGGVVLPMHAEIEASSRVFSFTATTGQIVVDTNQALIWRGTGRIDTDDFTSANRTFATASNKTYHLRWHASGTGDATPAATYPSGRFVLKDLADAGYNPSTLAEIDATFDGTFDDVLLARVVTDGSNGLTVTAFKNAATLRGTIYAASRDAGTFGSWSQTFTVGWARTPVLALSAMRPPSNGYDSDYDIYATSQNRIQLTVRSWSWHHSGAMQSPGFTYTLEG